MSNHRTERSRQLRVLFDAYWFHQGPPSQRHVMREMIAHWSQEFPDDHIGLLVRSRHLDTVRNAVGESVSLYPSRLWPHALTIMLESRFASKRHKAEAVITHNFASPFASNTFSFVHDFLFLDHPRWFGRMERLYFSLMPLTARFAKIIFTSSESEARRIRKHLPKNRVLPIGIGMTQELLNSNADSSISTTLQIIPQNFDLTVGRLNVRKNLAMTIQAALASGRATPLHPLIIVGEKNGKFEDLGTEALAAVENGSIAFAGFVSDAQLKWLYANARLFIFASRGEGFGMPPVEASYLGCPTLASDLDIFHETLGDAASYADTSDLTKFTSALANYDNATGGDTAVALAPAATLSWGKIVADMRTAISTEVPSCLLD